MTDLRSQSKTDIDRQEPCHLLKVTVWCPPQGPKYRKLLVDLTHLSILVAATHSYGAISQGQDKAT